ncbi:MAG: hypothetical protein R2854_07165 [Caldilineaceae bacterium]
MSDCGWDNPLPSPQLYADNDAIAAVMAAGAGVTAANVAAAGEVRLDFVQQKQWDEFLQRYCARGRGLCAPRTTRAPVRWSCAWARRSRWTPSGPATATARRCATTGTWTWTKTVRAVAGLRQQHAPAGRTVYRGLRPRRRGRGGR